MHKLQEILMNAGFDCTADPRGHLVVWEDLGDVVATIVENTTDSNREVLTKAVSWIQLGTHPDNVTFPYVKFEKS